MKYQIGNYSLVFDEVDTKQDKGTPRQIVPWRDVAATCRTLDAVCSVISGVDKELHIVDGIARSGFWGVVFRNRWHDCKLHLNEADSVCLPILQRNFPNDTITTFDIHNWQPEYCDLALLDFDYFTLRILDKWRDVLINWEAVCSKYFIIADGACFGFKFGNMKHYGIQSDLEYYYLLDEALSKFLSMKITVVSKFTNAATILLQPVKSKPKAIKFLEPSNLYLQKGAPNKKVPGLFF